MNLSDLLNGNSPAAQTFPLAPQPQVPMQPQAPLQGPGLAAASQQMPDIQAPLPATPQEFEQRKQAWGQVLGRSQQDPTLLRAMTVMGFSLMRPGANFGSAGLAGVAAYEEGRQADLNQQQTQRREGREQEAHDARMADSRDNREWNAKTRPMELEKLKADIASIPDAAKRRKLELQLQEIEVANAPEAARLGLEKLRAGTNASNASAAQAGRKTDMERLTEIMFNDPEIATIVDPNARRAAAAVKAYELAKTMPATIAAESRERVAGTNITAKRTTEEQAAVALYETYAALPNGHPTRLMIEIDPEQMVKVQQGAALLGKSLSEGAGSPTPTPAQAAKPTEKAPRRVFTSDEIEKSLRQ